MKKLILHIFLLPLICSEFTLVAQTKQDTLYVDNDKQYVLKVVKVTSDIVTAKDEQGETTKFATKRIAKIVYASGETDAYIESQIEKHQNYLQYSLNYGKNIVSVNTIYLANGILELQYEHFIVSALSVNAYFSNNLSNQRSFQFNSLRRNRTIGTELRFYPKLQGRLRYFLGIGYETGFYSHGADYQDTDYLNFYYFHNGFIYNMSPSITISPTLSLGTFDEMLDPHSFNSPVNFKLQLGYRF